MRAIVLILASVTSVGCRFDSNSPKDPATPDAIAARSCGTTTCDPRSQFCYQIAAGVQGVTDLDAAPGCDALPMQCATAPTCACVKSVLTSCGGGLTCAEDAGFVTVTCSQP